MGRVVLLNAVVQKSVGDSFISVMLIFSMFEIITLVMSGIAIGLSSLALYYSHFVGPDIKLVFSKQDRTAIFEYRSGGMAEFTGVFINTGNRTGYLLNTNMKTAGIFKNNYFKLANEAFLKGDMEELNKVTAEELERTHENKNILHVPNFIVEIEPKAPLGISFAPDKIDTPLQIREGDSYPFTVFIHRSGGSTIEEDRENLKWFKEHSGLKIKIKIYYTTTTNSGLKPQDVTLNLKI